MEFIVANTKYMYIKIYVIANYYSISYCHFLNFSLIYRVTSTVMILHTVIKEKHYTLRVNTIKQHNNNPSISCRLKLVDLHILIAG